MAITKPGDKVGNEKVEHLPKAFREKIGRNVHNPHINQRYDMNNKTVDPRTSKGGKNCNAVECDYWRPKRPGSLTKGHCCMVPPGSRCYLEIIGKTRKYTVMGHELGDPDLSPENLPEVKHDGEQ